MEINIDFLAQQVEYTVHCGNEKISTHTGTNADYHAVLMAVAARNHYGNRTRITIAADGAFISAIPIITEGQRKPYVSELVGHTKRVVVQHIKQRLSTPSDAQ